MNVPLVDRTPLLLQKAAQRPGSRHNQNSSNGNAVMQTLAHTANQPGTGTAVDKKA